MSQQDSLFNEPGPKPQPRATSTSPGPTSLATGTDDMAAVVKALQSQVATLLVLLLIVSGTMTIYLFRQVSHVRKDLEATRPRAQQMIDEYNQRTAPAIQRFTAELGKYAETHPDVLPILARYGLVRQNEASTGVMPAPPDLDP